MNRTGAIKCGGTPMGTIRQLNTSHPAYSPIFEQGSIKASRVTKTAFGSRRSSTRAGTSLDPGYGYLGVVSGAALDRPSR